MVSDGLSVMNADFSATSFRVGQVRIGERTFLGNNIAVPTGARIGDNVLLGTKVMVPVSGPVRHDVGLLGSPPFEIPRSVQRDTQFDHLKTGPVFRSRLAAKNRHNLTTMALFLLVRWLYFAAVVLVMSVSFDRRSQLGVWATAAGLVVALILAVLLFGLIERATMGFRAMRPQYCSIYDRYYWRHERFWKLSATVFIGLFNGTPFKSWIWRLLGVRVGRKLYDDGCGVPEKTLVSIGDGCTLNSSTVIQCHSLEDGTFKSGRTVIGSGATLGINAFIHYGVEVGRDVVVGADSFVMKGEQIPAGQHWRGNPAGQVDADTLGTTPTAGPFDRAVSLL
jgi:non-ribosomal peptide synthetase-like protein